MRPDFFYLRRAVRVLIIISIIFPLIPAELKAKDKSNDTFSKDPAVQKRIAEGIRLGKDGEYEQAIAEFKEALKPEPKNVHALNNIGVAYFKLNKLDEAVSYYTKAVNLGVANATTYFFRGIIIGKHRREPAKAVKDFTKAIELQPRFSRAYVNRASAYSSLKQYDKAVADYNKAVELQPSIVKAIIEKRAIAYYKKGDHAKAWADVEKAKELGVKVDKKFVADLKKAMQKKQDAR